MIIKVDIFLVFYNYYNITIIYISIRIIKLKISDNELIRG